MDNTPVPQSLDPSCSQPPESKTQYISQRESPLPKSSSSADPSSTMTGPQIVDVFRKCEVPDLTKGLKGPRSGPISFGSSGCLYHSRSAEGEVAVRTIRLFLVFNHKNQRLLKAAADELLVWQRLQHENIVPLLGVACFHEQPALVSPWIHFGNLTEFRLRQPLFDWLKMCTQVSRAIAYMHENGVTHGDIKAQNVLVSDEGDAKVVGFGNSILRELALHYRDGHDLSTLSMRWTAPEVLEGAPSKSPSVDIYALGMTILEIITGEIPFHEIATDQAVVLKVVNRVTPPRPRELASNDRIWTLLTTCWGDAKTRPTAQQVCNTLESMA